VTLRFRAELAGRLLRRYQRFFADVETDDGRTLTVHCPNPGSMLGCAPVGAPVRCSDSADERRKLRYTLEMVRVGRAWVGVNTLRANGFARSLLEAGRVHPLAGYASVEREVAVGEGSRLDFRLGGHARDARPAFVEVKSVTLARERVARFPDSRSVRGTRHAEALARLRKDGARAVLLFVVQRADCERVEPADDIDPEYGAALRAAAGAGVEVLAVRARVGPGGLRFDGRLPVCL
jgi:sugar fermentation stimulation protein A